MSDSLKPRQPNGGLLDQEQAAVVLKQCGPTLVQRFFSASKTILVHDLTNRAARNALERLVAALKPLFVVDSLVSIRTNGDFININDVRIAVDPQNFGPFRYMMDAMQERDIEGIEITEGIDVTEAGLFLQLFFKDYEKDGAYGEISKEIERIGLAHVKVVQWVDREMHLRDNEVKRKKPRVRDIKSESNQVFVRTASLVGEVLKGIEKRRAIQVRKAERLTQQMVDIIQVDESILVGLASIKSFDEYTFAHSVNVAILSMLIGDRIGLEKRDVARLGVAGLLHDIGKTYVPQSILNKPDKLEDQDWELMKYHTFFGVAELSRVKAMREIGDAFFVTLQHHVHYNQNGYPQRDGGWKLRLFSRITTIADYFDAMTTPRVYQDPLTPDRALRFIIERSGDIFDPFLAKVFIRSMGVYPVGTVVRLNTGQKAVVTRQNEEGLIHRPLVMVIDEDKPASEAEQLDLARRGSDNSFFYKVERAYYDKESELLKTRFFLSE